MRLPLALVSFRRRCYRTLSDGVSRDALEGARVSVLASHLADPVGLDARQRRVLWLFTELYALFVK